MFAIVLGASLTFGYAPWSLWFITPIILATFLSLLKQSQVSGQQLGFCFGVGWFGAGISWVHVSIEQFGGLPLVGSLALMALLCAYLALYPALAFGVIKRFIAWPTWWYALPVVWFVAEWLRGWVLTGFPWLSLGYTQTHGWLSVWAPIIGETGLSMLLMLVAVCLAQIIHATSTQAKALCTGVLIVVGCASALLQSVSWFQAADKAHDIVMVQGNIKQELRWVPEQDVPTMRKYLDLTEPHWNADIIIWPEAAIPRIEPLAHDYLTDLDERALATETGLITGIVNYNFENQQAYNSLITLGKTLPKQGQADTKQGNSLTSDSEPELRQADSGRRGQYFYQHNNRYEKHHLLPIGEFIPFERWIRALAPIFDLPMSSFSRGQYQQTNLLANGARFVPAICFEIAFPQQIRANLQQSSDFIITVSNDAWFGNSHGPHQHLEIAQMRAKELGIPVLRATNNGITAFINSDGSIASQAPQFEEATLAHKVISNQQITPYRYFGEFPHWLLVVLVMVSLLNQQIRARKTQQLIRPHS